MTQENQSSAGVSETTETETIPSQQDSKENAQPVSVASEKPSEPHETKTNDVGTKLSGFFGSLAKKARNLDVKELAEKAKSLDVKELTEKARQKVNEVKDKAVEISTGKTDSFVTLREEISDEQMKELYTKASEHLIEEVSPIVSCLLKDVSQGEQVILTMKFGGSDNAHIAISSKTLYYFVKSSDHFMVYSFPVEKIINFSLLPPRGETVGRFTIFTETEEIKLILSSLEGYVKSLILYKKIKELIQR